MNAIIIFEVFKTKKYVIFLSLTEAENRVQLIVTKRDVFKHALNV